MQLDYKGDKGFRLLNLYERLNKGETVSKGSPANDFGVSPMKDRIKRSG